MSTFAGCPHHVLDAFAALFDELSRQRLSELELADLLEELLTPAGEYLQAELHRTIRPEAEAWGSLAEDVRTRIDNAVTAGPAENLTLLAALLVLDSILGEVWNITGWSFPASSVGLAKLRQELIESAVWICPRSGGILVPRRSKPMCDPDSTAPETLQDVLTVLRLPHDTARDIAWIRLRPNEDVDVTSSGEEVRILSIPFLAEFEDVTLKPDMVTSTRHGYISEHVVKLEMRVNPSLQAIKEEVASSSVPTVVLLPELALNDTIVEKWRTELGSDATDSLHNVGWLVIGSGPHNGTKKPGASAGPIRNTRNGRKMWPNRVVVLSRTGRVLAVGDKRYGFSIPRSLWKAYGIDGRKLPDRLEKLSEGMIHGRQLTVMESTLGRVALVICEDLGRLENLLKLLKHAGVSIVLNPIFATPIKDRQWTATVSSFLRQADITTVTCNGLARTEDVELKKPTIVAFDPHQKDWSRIGDPAKPLKGKRIEQALTARSLPIRSR